MYEKITKQKRYSVTTSAGIKIQPYFDVPPPNDQNLYYFRVQSEPIDTDHDSPLGCRIDSKRTKEMYRLPR